MNAPVPADEAVRLAALRRLDILDTTPEGAYEDIVLLASHICETPIAAVNFIDGQRQWSKARIGLAEASLPREASFCAHTILNPAGLTVVPEVRADARFAGHPLVVGDPHLRFYAGVPLVTPSGEALGTLCVADRVPRSLTPAQAAALAALARQVMAQLELRRHRARLEHANAVLARESATDALTGLLNRRAFEERLEAEVKRARRYGSPLSLLMLDVDGFKAYNDTFGHPAGDDVLRQVAALLESSTRRTDVVARYGGEEFAVIVSETALPGALLLAERCRRAVAGASWPHRGVTLSVGAATLSAGVWTGRDLTEAADGALYRAKQDGRNRVAGPATPRDDAAP